MKQNKLIFILLLILLVLIFFCILLLFKNNNKVETFYKDPVKKLTKDQCMIWLERKNQTFKKAYNPLTDSYDIIKYSNNYYTIDDQCEKYEKLYTPFLNKEIPIYLQILYKLLDNIVNNYECNPKKYKREKDFGKWTSRNKCNTRDKILYDESIKKDIKFYPSRCNLNKDCEPEDYKCSIMEGEWIPYTGDYYSNNDKGSEKLYTNSNDLQIDHTVPLKNAYISGACKWTEEQRNVYANDRTPGHLSIMVNYLNTEKGDNTPYRWLPPANELRYISNWISVKYRYNLKLSINEFNILHKLLDKYKQFIPDEPIKEDEEKGNSLQKINKNYKGDELLQTNINIHNIRLFKDNYPEYILKICDNIKPGEYKNSTDELKRLRDSLKINNNHIYFGILRPEIIDSLNDNNICNLFF